jgi:hypothetical protein
VSITIRGLASLFVGRGVRRVFFRGFYLLRRTPLPIRLQVYQSEVVYYGFRSNNRQDPADMQKAIPSLLPFLAFFMAMSVLSHRGNEKLCLVSFLKMMKIVLSSQT